MTMARGLRDGGTGGTADAVFSVTESDLPLAALRPGTALAIICGTEGPSYRPCGAGMAITAEGRVTGHLSAGCIDRDVAHHAQMALRDGRPRQLRYGAGSPFRDLELPCGGGLDILIEPAPDTAQLAQARRQLAQRCPAELRCGQVRLHILPELRFLVFGNGPEARIFAATAHSAGYPTELLSADAETLAGLDGLRTQEIGLGWPAELAVDARTSISMFFHDHDRELALLPMALGSSAFYVGAMGSARAADKRAHLLREQGLAPELIARLSRPFGVVPSTRNPRSLAISVLADILSRTGHS